MSLKSYKNEVYLNYGYLAIEKNFKPANTFEKEAIVNSLWLLSFNRELTDYPEENLNKLILIKENLNYLIKVAEHMQISTEQDHLFIQSILTFFKITSNKKNLLDMFDFLIYCRLRNLQTNRLQETMQIHFLHCKKIIKFRSCKFRILWYNILRKCQR